MGLYFIFTAFMSSYALAEEVPDPSLVKISDERKADEVTDPTPSKKSDSDKDQIEKMEDDPFIDNYGNGETTNLKLDEEDNL